MRGDTPVARCIILSMWSIQGRRISCGEENPKPPICNSWVQVDKYGTHTSIQQRERHRQCVTRSGDGGRVRPSGSVPESTCELAIKYNIRHGTKVKKYSKFYPRVSWPPFSMRPQNQPLPNKQHKKNRKNPREPLTPPPNPWPPL